MILIVTAAFERNRAAMHNLRRQIFHADFFAAAKHQAALQGILQFAHVARPIVFFNRCQRLAFQSRRSPEPCAVHLQEGLCQQREVSLMRAQWWQFNRHHAQPVE